MGCRWGMGSGGIEVSKITFPYDLQDFLDLLKNASPSNFFSHFFLHLKFRKQKSLVSISPTRDCILLDVVRTGIEPVFYP